VLKSNLVRLPFPVTSDEDASALSQLARGMCSGWDSQRDIDEVVCRIFGLSEDEKRLL